MITTRKSDQRGNTKIDWLDSRHTFSFGEYYDPSHMGFRTLRVINEDLVRPGAGFPTHAHRDMEIITYVLEGALEHKDSIGNGSTISPGEVQRMSAGKGITHSEFNHSRTEPVHFLQIWLTPSRLGIEPGYEQRPIDLKKARGTLLPIATPDGREGSVTLHQDATLSVAKLGNGETVDVSLKPARQGWLQVARGEVSLNGVKLAQGDGAEVADEEKVRIVADSPAEILWFDMA
jgi:redox-sensitive bicupin YhaK (pirin superfamily)